MNKCIFIGRLTKDPELKVFDWGKVLNFSIAVNRPYKNEDGSRSADFIDIQIKGNQAETGKEILKKGMKIAIDTTYQKNKYEKDGETRYHVLFVSGGFEIIDWNKKEEISKPAPHKPSLRDIETPF